MAKHFSNQYPPRHPSNKWASLGIVAIGTFMSALDGSVVNTALPVIQQETHAPMTTTAWVVLVYLLVVSASLLVFGRLGDMYGRKVFYIGGMATFVVGSLLCGLSPEIHWLIAFRALQALGAAALFALAPAILTGAFPGNERGRALGMQATATYLGLATGPTIGGIITQHLGWRWIFFMNVPIGALAVPWALYTLKNDGLDRAKKFDVAGAFTLAVGLTCLLFGINEGGRMGWDHLAVTVTLITGVAALTSFVIIERRVANPLIDFRLFTSFVFTASTIASLLSYMATSSVSLLMPFYLEIARGFRVDTAGYILASTPVAMALLTGLSGTLSDKIGQRIPATIGLTIVVIAVLSLRTIEPTSDWFSITWRLVLIGVGVGFFTSPNNSAIMGSAPNNRQGVAGAILAAARNIGFVLGTAIAVAIYSPRLNALKQSSSESVAITYAMQDATTAIAIVAIAGIVLSAIHGKVQPK